MRLQAFDQRLAPFDCAASRLRSGCTEFRAEGNALVIALVLATALAQLDGGEPVETMPVAQAPAPVAADAEAFTWSPRAELFGTFEAGQTDTAGTYDQFDLPRVHLGAEA